MAATSASAQAAAFVAVDWGTSSFRAWLMAADGAVLAETRSHEGMSHCATGGFESVLRRQLSTLGAAAELPVLICGMAGARQGWLEAPYLTTPTALGRLHDGAVRVQTEGDVRILPGVAHDERARADVMRGEETQLLGATAADFSGLVCIPGTHSKWIRIEHGKVLTFSTYMTGELFAVLTRHSILAHATQAEESPASDGEAFQAGLAAAHAAPTGLTTALFRLRAAQLLGYEDRSEGASRLSGLLIGSEIADAARRDTTRTVRLIAAGGLGALYHSALQQAGFVVELVDAEHCSRAGLAKAAASLWRF